MMATVSLDWYNQAFQNHEQACMSDYSHMCLHERQRNNFYLAACYHTEVKPKLTRVTKWALKKTLFTEIYCYYIEVFLSSQKTMFQSIPASRPCFLICNDLLYVKLLLPAVAISQLFDAWCHKIITKRGCSIHCSKAQGVLFRQQWKNIIKDFNFNDSLSASC